MLDAKHIFNKTLVFILPSLAGIYSALNYLETNTKSLEYWNMISITSVLIFSGLALLAFFRVFGLSIAKSSLVATLILIYCIYGNAVFLIVQRILERDLSYSFFNSLIGIIICLIIFLLHRTKIDFQITVQILTSIFIVSSTISIAKITVYESQRMDELKITPLIANEHFPSLKLAGKNRNIFYIILDRYADQKTLTTMYDFDNSEFTGMLRKNGFFVANNSASNYPFTSQSLSSSLNMAYHEIPNDQIITNGDDLVPYYRLIRNNRVTSILKEIGYKYIHMGSWWMPSETNPNADENFNTTFLGRVALSFLHRSVFEPLLYLTNSDKAKKSIDPNQCDRVPQKVQRIKELASTENPTFVFAHFLLPHDPFVFDKDGRCKKATETKLKSLEENYLAHLEYSNFLVKQIVETLLSQPGLKPIIIIQADEGPYPTRYRQNEKTFQWTSATRAEIRQKMRILNAYFFPGVDNSIFHNSITPVNSFRLLLNSYFSTNLKLLTDQNFAFPNNENKYDFFPVTETVRIQH